MPTKQISSSLVVVKELTESFYPLKNFSNEELRFLEKVPTRLNFKKYLLDITEPFAGVPKMSFEQHLYSDDTEDKDIMLKLSIDPLRGNMTKEEILWVAINLTDPPIPNKTARRDGNNTTIGYLRCYDGIVRSVSVHYHFITEEWHYICSDPGKRKGPRTVLRLQK